VIKRGNSDVNHTVRDIRAFLGEVVITNRYRIASEVFRSIVVILGIWSRLMVHGYVEVWIAVYCRKRYRQSLVFKAMYNEVVVSVLAGFQLIPNRHILLKLVRIKSGAIPHGKARLALFEFRRGNVNVVHTLGLIPRICRQHADIRMRAILRRPLPRQPTGRFHRKVGFPISGSRRHAELFVLVRSKSCFESENLPVILTLLFYRVELINAGKESDLAVAVFRLLGRY
jgi:hypothetical protein